jgi:hypothetical protein
MKDRIFKAYLKLLKNGSESVVIDKIHGEKGSRKVTTRTCSMEKRSLSRTIIHIILYITNRFKSSIGLGQ